ncbi:hypothetical protein [Streptomyces sp. MST-110588]|uniref:hypothetical protein n=1 Tax=Streptomyces sp. MST-110588 TaxID=2833628 RepID=UPI001F5DC282|nr:hypothetical protein [Streptomyces sp. MST-110588]UNO38473.1 hypothetical protein KGS77_00945 [Streptomyces sp. MST-110588]
MTFGWLRWLRYADDFGYSHGLLPGTVGTVAVLGTAFVAGYLLRRVAVASWAVPLVLTGAGIAWLATH